MSFNDAVFTSRHRSRLAFICPVLASTAFVIELAIIPMLLPALQAEFNLTHSEIVWVFNIYGVAVACGVLLGGVLGDYDRQRMFRYGVVLFALGAALTALAANHDIVLAGRFLQGAGGGLFSVVVPVLLSQAAADRPGRVLVVWGSIAGIAATVSPFIAGFALASTGWRPVILVIGLLACLALALPKLRIDTRSQVAATPDGIITLLGNVKVWSILGYIFLTYGSFLYVSFEVPRQVQAAGYSDQVAGAVVALLWFTFAASSLAIRNHVDGRWLNWILLSAPITTGCAVFLLLHQNGIVMIVGSAICVGLGLALCNGPSTHILLRLVSDRQKSLTASLDITAARLGGAAIVWLIASLSLAAGTIAVISISVIAIILGALGAAANRRTTIMP